MKRRKLMAVLSSVAGAAAILTGVTLLFGAAVALIVGGVGAVAFGFLGVDVG